jgi:tetratricopeptide (TPR) repeat protein
MREHPDRETLQQFISGQLGSEDARLTDRHLAVCSECRDRAEEVSEWLALQLLDSWLRPGYDEAFERAADRAANSLALIIEEARSKEDSLDSLLQASISERRLRIANEKQFQTLKLSEFLRSRSRNSWYLDPAVALELADLAVEVAQRLDTAKYARALAWAYLGNAYRINSDLWRAERAIQRAWLHHFQAERDAYTETELLNLSASLRSTQGSHEEAVSFSDRAISIYREAEDLHSEGGMMIQKGFCLGLGGHCRQAIYFIRSGLEKISPDQEPRLLLAGRHNLIWSLANSGAPEVARDLLEQSWPLFHSLDYRVGLVRLRWLEGQIARDLGDFTMAKAAMFEVRDFFLDHQIGIDAFLVSLDLAEVYVHIGRPRQVKEVLENIIPLGEALGLKTKVLVARLLYEQASRG